MKNQNSALVSGAEKFSFSQFVQKTQEETMRVQNLLDSIENESLVKNSLAQSRSGFYNKSTDLTRSKVSDLDQEIVNVQNKILMQKKQICQQKVEDQHALRKLKILEQVYQHSQQKYNAALSKNRLIRDHVDTLRKDQKIFKDLCRNLQSSIVESERDMERMTNKGSTTRNNREVAEVQIRELESQADVEAKEYGKSISALRGLIRKEKCLKDEIGSIKVHSNSTPDIKTLENEDGDIKKKIIRMSWKIAQDKANMIMSLNKLEEYEDIIKKFQDLTGVSNYESLLKHYMSTREHNITLSKYVDGLTLELHQLENQLAEVKSQVTNYRILENEEVGEKITEEKNKTEQKEKKMKDNFEKMKKKVEQTFAKVGCKGIKGIYMLNEYEVAVARIKEIEKRCHEIIGISTGFKAEPQRHPKSTYKLEVEIPAFQDKEKDTEEEEGHLTWQEFGSKDLKKAKRKK